MTARWCFAAVGLAGLACRVIGAGDRRLTLQFANPADYAEHDVERRVLAPFLELNPGVRVVQQSVASYRGGGEYRDRIVMSIGAGAPPDVFLLDQSDAPSLVDGGLLLDLAPYLPRLNVDLSRYDSTVLGIFRRGAAVYALPKGYTPIVLAYNRDLFDQAGLAYPTDNWTWDDFLRAARRLTRDTDGDGRVDQWGTMFDRRSVLWLPWLWSGGGDVLCPDGQHASGCLDSPASIAALQWYTAWVTRDSVAPRTTSQGKTPDDILRLFASGRVAMMTVGHFWIPSLRALQTDRRLPIGFAEIPHRQGFAPRTMVVAAGFAVPAIAAHRRGSVELAVYLADTLAQRVRAEAGEEVPSVRAVAESIAVRDTSGWERVFLRALAHARVPWGARIERWHAVEAVLPDLLDRITSTGADPAIAAHDAARQIDQILAAPPAGESAVGQRAGRSP